MFKLKKSSKTIFLGLLSVSMTMLTACDSIIPNNLENTLLENVVTISGSVGDGPIIGAEVSARDTNGIIVGVGSSDEFANYQIIVPRQSNFPLVIKSTGGIDTVTFGVPSFDLYSIIESSQNITVNINPYSTFITKIAEDMPYGLTRENIATATQNVVKKFNYGLDPDIVLDPIKTKINADNIAVIVKASETFSEMIRRVQASLQEQGININANEVIDILAYDFIDGFIDGTGVHEHAPRIAALANIINASVLLESMSNQLKVASNDVSSAMDSAIRLTMPTVPVSVTTDDVPINKEMVYQTLAALNAAMTIAPPSQEITSLISIIESIAYGTSSESVATTISLDLDLTFSTVLSALQSASTEQIAAINEKARETFEALTNDVTGGGSTGGGSTGGGSTGGGSTGGGSTGGGSTGGGSTGGGSTGGGSPFDGLITATSPAPYVWGTLELNSKVFVDRTIKYTTIPTEFVSSDVLRTANDDKKISSDSLIVFSISKTATVYIAHDIRITNKPAWLASWNDTGVDIIASDTTRRLFSNSFAAGTVVLGSNNGNSGSSMYSVIVRGLDSSEPTAKPIAVNDSVETEMSTAINIDVLLNDRDLDDTPISLSIVDSPVAGTLTIEANNTITYAPGGAAPGTYNFVYQISDNDGDLATASVNINILCTSCANDVDVSLTWDANPSSENVNGYKILYRLSTDASSKFLADIPVTQSGFDATNPSITYNAGADMGLMYGNNVCFSVQAYNYGGTSTASTEVCSGI